MKLILSTLILLLIPGLVIAETIYKSVDKNGNVHYSNIPPENTENATSIELAPPPSQEAIRAAQQRHERNKKAASILDENRKKRDEISAEENRLKRESQKQSQQQRQAEKNNENKDYIYPYIPGRRPGGMLPPAHRPVQLPAR